MFLIIITEKSRESESDLRKITGVGVVVFQNARSRIFIRLRNPAFYTSTVICKCFRPPQKLLSFRIKSFLQLV